MNSFKCSCLPPSTHEHNPDCQCRCETCDEARSCPCTPQKCECLLLCNCQCRNCHKTPSSAPDLHPVVEARRDCIALGCTKSAPAGNTRCSSCETHRRVHRECAIPGCTRSAPVGGYQGHGMFCAECCQNPLIFDHDPGCRRYCKEEMCDRLAPVGSDSGMRCPKCKNQRGAAMRKRKADELIG